MFLRGLIPSLCSLIFNVPALLAAPRSLVVQTTSGSFQGTLTGNGTERWLGIPFAQPPTGDLRFKAPVKISKVPHGIQMASTFGNACPQLPRDLNAPINDQLPRDLGAPTNEDCLFLNVWRPTGTSPSDELPVLVWIHGGAYIWGAASEPSTEPTRFINRSVQNGKPIIFVSLNYRLNTFGFLASRFVPPQDLNAGLHDQRAALEFVQENIASFGGDPSKVTIWGQSAGAGSVEAHLIYPAPRPLFRAAMAESPTGPFKSAPFAFQYDEPGKPFARLVERIGCPLDSTSVSCLRRVPFETLLSVSNDMINSTLNFQLWEPAIGPPGSFAEARASAKIALGAFRHVPFLAGTNLNEGTTFSTTLINITHPGESEDQVFDEFIGNLILDARTLTHDVLGKINELYPANDPANDAPFNTGDSLFDRASAFYGDTMFLAPRRLFFDKAASLQPLYGYHFREFIPGNDPTLGVAHADELVLLYGPAPPPVEEDLANTILDHYISFVNDMNPGSSWPKFTSNGKKVLQLMRDNITVIDDDFNLKKTAFLNSAKVLNEMEK